MKKILSIAAVITLALMFAQMSFAQATATQTVNLSVGAISKIAITGSPITLTVTTANVGTDALVPATDNSSTYSITHNSATALRITANLDQVVPAGYSLQINLAPTAGKGTSAGTIDISNALAASAVAVVTAIPKGADANRTITYTFNANASAGTLASTARIVTLTLTN